MTNSSLVIKNPDEVWKTFARNFWAMFICYVLTRGLSHLQVHSSADAILVIVFTVLEVIIFLAMPWMIGSSIYKLTGRKVDLLWSLLGFFWFYGLGIFVAYFVVKWKYHTAIGNPYPRREKIALGLYCVFLLFLLVGTYLAASEIGRAKNAQTQVTTNPFDNPLDTSP